jgi:succinyl-diaminopimelate desuccinylase
MGYHAAMSSALTDPIPLAQALIRRPSVTPANAGALDVLGEALQTLGFDVRRLPFGDVDNLYARLGDGRPNLCFAGHTDVVPVGDAAAWRFDPFGATIENGLLYGRGAADMKAAIAAMVAAVASRVETLGPPPGAISFLITGDEEGPALDGTVKLLPLLHESGERLDACVVGEPSSVSLVGDVVKNGRRGSLNAVITVEGKQGHVAYPKLALNPMGPLLDLLNMLRTRMLDSGAPGFDPSNLEVTTVDVGNAAHNVIAARATAKLNIRFNTRHSGKALLEWLEETRQRVLRLYPKADIRIEARATGEPFYTAPGPLTEVMQAAVRDVTGRTSELSTSGGTSDARFIKDYCPVAELGLQNATAHMVDEHVAVADIEALAQIYRRVIDRFFDPDM